MRWLSWNKWTVFCHSDTDNRRTVRQVHLLCMFVVGSVCSSLFIQTFPILLESNLRFIQIESMDKHIKLTYLAKKDAAAEGFVLELVLLVLAGLRLPWELLARCGCMCGLYKGSIEGREVAGLPALPLELWDGDWYSIMWGDRRPFMEALLISIYNKDKYEIWK